MGARNLKSGSAQAPGDIITLTKQHLAKDRLSRRSFLRGASAATVLGGAVASGLVLPRFAEAAAPGVGDVVPVPGGTILPGYHVNAPPDDPSSVFNLQGNVGLAFINGQVTERNTKTGASRVLPFTDADMRFMQGKVQGKDGHVRDGTFVFIWVDVYDPSLGGAQIRDLNPGIEQSGLFWTAVVPVEAVAANFAAGTAMVQMSDYHLKDYHDLQNGIFGGGPNPVPATLSFRAQWNCPAAGGTANIAAQKYRGTVKVGTAQMEWSARIGDMLYQSFPIGTSTSDFAELVQESNGTFY